MKLLYVIDSIGAGGAERSLAAMAPHYVRRGIDLDVAFLIDRPGLRPEFETSGANLFNLEGSGGRSGSIGRARSLISQRRPDLVHTTLFEADIAGRIAATLARVPVVSSLVNIAYGPEQLLDPALRRWKVRAAQFVDAMTARRVARFHAVTNYVAETMAGRLHIRRDKIEVIPRGRNPEDLGSRTPERSTQVRNTLGVPADQPLILVIARHEHQKGLDLLIRALPKVLVDTPHVRVLIAGREGNKTSELRSLLHAHGLEEVVTFLGPREDVPDLLCAADLFVLPTRWEGFPGALLEAMALEAPIVATDLPNVREATGDGTALLVKPESPDSLALQIMQSIADPEGAAERAERARARFLERFTIERVADAMMDFYRRTLNGET